MPVSRDIVRRQRPDPALFVGSGVAERLGEQFHEAGVELVVFDHPISAVQQRNLERLWKLRVSDRTELIIDIFSQRARSHEGKLQVELAQLEHIVGAAGPGVVPPRAAARRYRRARRSGRDAARARPADAVDPRQDPPAFGSTPEGRAPAADPAARARQRGEACAVSIVGYTNAGKSTLFNALTGAEYLRRRSPVRDPRSHRAPDRAARRRRGVILADTVGFVRDLPHGLVAAFRATLEETARPICCCMWSIPPIPSARIRYSKWARCWPKSAPATCRAVWSTTRSICNRPRRASRSGCLW